MAATNPVFESIFPIDGGAPRPSEPVVAPVPAPAPLSAAVQRFQSCRWRRTAEQGAPEGCAHRDVLPITGTHGFVPDAWCPDCAFYKLRRTPKKRDYLSERY